MKSRIFSIILCYITNRRQLKLNDFHQHEITFPENEIIHEEGWYKILIISTPRSPQAKRFLAIFLPTSRPRMNVPDFKRFKALESNHLGHIQSQDV